MKKINKNMLSITIPTLLTLTRIALTPFIALAISYDCWIIAGTLFTLCALTDALDGFIARRYNQQTLLGALLDPLADKVLIIALFVTFAAKKVFTLQYSLLVCWAYYH